MTALLVADVGNSRIKWGWCDDEQVVKAASLPLGDGDGGAWAEQHRAWRLEPSVRCVLAGSNPPALEALASWLAGLGHPVERLDSFRKLPIQVDVEQPEQVGLDRLLNAVAACSTGGSGRPAVVVDAGSAVTVDWIDERNVFKGGAILPGLRLMAQALHAYTAKLPVVPPPTALPPMPGVSTEKAIAAGVHAAFAGGILYLVEQLLHDLLEEDRGKLVVFVTGGDGALVTCSIEPQIHRLGVKTLTPWPWMTLEGIRFSAMRGP